MMAQTEMEMRIMRLEALVDGMKGGISSATKRTVSAPVPDTFAIRNQYDLSSKIGKNVPGAEYSFVSNLLVSLSGQISATELATSLSSRIDLIDAPTTGLVTVTSTLAATDLIHTAAIQVEQQVRATAVAPDYSAASTYALYATVQYNGALYRCSTAIGTPEAWNPAHWTAISANLYAKYTVKMDVNGYVSGFGMANDGTTSDFIVNCDNFAVGKTGATSKYPFIVSGGTVYMDSALISSLTADKIAAGNLTVALTLSVGGEIKNASSPNTRWEINETHLAGYNGTTLQWEALASDGKMYCGAGALCLSSNGVDITSPSDYTRQAAISFLGPGGTRSEIYSFIKNAAPVAEVSSNWYANGVGIAAYTLLTLSTIGDSGTSAVTKLSAQSTSTVYFQVDGQNDKALFSGTTFDLGSANLKTSGNVGSNNVSPSYDFDCGAGTMNAATFRPNNAGSYLTSDGTNLSVSAGLSVGSSLFGVGVIYARGGIANDTGNLSLSKGLITLTIGADSDAVNRIVSNYSFRTTKSDGGYICLDKTDGKTYKIRTDNGTVIAEDTSLT